MTIRFPRVVLDHNAFVIVTVTTLAIAMTMRGPQPPFACTAFRAPTRMPPHHPSLPHPVRPSGGGRWMSRQSRPRQDAGCPTTTRLREGADPLEEIFRDNRDLPRLREYLRDRHPSFYALVELNDDGDDVGNVEDSVWRYLGTSVDGGFTLFVPVEDVLRDMDEDRRRQLLDVRNLETTKKIVACHFVNEIVTFDDLYDAGGVVSMGGTLAVERSRKGGLFGVGGTDDGGVLVGRARILDSVPFGNAGILHEVDEFVAPAILWRYMDQLRIPGSK